MVARALPLLLPLALAACSVTVAPPNGTVPGGGGGVTPAGAAVTFIVKADARAFSDKQPIRLTVWDADQLAIADRTSGCSVSMGPEGERTTCPPGVTYQKPTPEEVTVTKAQLTAGYRFETKTVTTGERYRLTLGGKASDDCNSAGASTEGTAAQAEIAVTMTDIAQTMMACIDGPPPTAGAVRFTLDVDATKFSDKKQITIRLTDEAQTTEEIIVSHADLTKPYSFTSKHVMAGERYDLSVSGIAADGCNTASANAQGTAGTTAVTLELDQVAQTKMACLPKR